MTPAGRFQIRTLLSEQGEVRSYGGLDALTGLPVLIYRFPGPPMLGLGELKSDAIPGILHSSYNGREGELVVAFAPGYKPLDAPVAAHLVSSLLLDSATALEDAARAGVLHGNLKPERFLGRGGHCLIEGYGVHWRPEASPFTAPEALEEASYAGDVFSWAKALEFLCGPNLPEELIPLFEKALSLDPHERSLATELREAVSVLGAPAAGADSSAPSSVHVPVVSPVLPSVSPPAPPPVAPPVAPGVTATPVPRRQDAGAAVATAPEPRAQEPENEDEAGVFAPQDLEEDGTGSDEAGGERDEPPVLEPPPVPTALRAQGATARDKTTRDEAAQDEAKREPRRRLRPLLLAALAVSIVILVLLTAVTFVIPPQGN